MKWKKWISTGLSMIMAVSAFALTAPRVRGAEEKPTEPGLWITEIYQNDVKREDLFDNSSDHMEFVEVINTSDRSVELGSDTLWYEYPSGDAYVMKRAHDLRPRRQHSGCTRETVVLWSQRTDLGGGGGGQLRLGGPIPSGHEGSLRGPGLPGFRAKRLCRK